MAREKLLKYIVFLMFFMFLANTTILKFHWYYSIWWIDMLMHFLGGLWLGLFFLYVFYDQNHVWKQFLAVILCVLVVGILWEFFEFYLNIISTEALSMNDTLSDIFLDLAGGLTALLYFFKIIMPKEVNTIHPVVEL